MGPGTVTFPEKVKKDLYISSKDHVSLSSSSILHPDFNKNYLTTSEISSKVGTLVSPLHAANALTKRTIMADKDVHIVQSKMPAYKAVDHARADATYQEVEKDINQAIIDKSQGRIP